MVWAWEQARLGFHTYQLRYILAAIQVMPSNQEHVYELAARNGTDYVYAWLPYSYASLSKHSSPTNSQVWSCTMNKKGKKLIAAHTLKIFLEAYDIQ